MTEVKMTERQMREREYYNKYAANFDLEGREIDLSPVMGPLAGTERRPWNSYWSVYEAALDTFKVGSRLLDFGSGPGENALRFAKMGYLVSGFDISESNVAISCKLFQKHGEKAIFHVCGAEKLPYKDEMFDLVAGIDILHHVDIPKSLEECRRVLKKGGKAIFREPVEAPFVDWLRNTKPALALAPKEASFELHITEDERKLNKADEDSMRRIFPKMKKRHFMLFSRFDRFFRKGSDKQPSFLEKFDFLLLKYFPVTRRFAGAVIYELEK